MVSDWAFIGVCAHDGNFELLLVFDEVGETKARAFSFVETPCARRCRLRWRCSHHGSLGLCPHLLGEVVEGANRRRVEQRDRLVRETVANLLQVLTLF